MARRTKIPNYGTVTLNGVEYYRTRIQDSDGKRVALYAKTREELFDKVESAKQQIAELRFNRDNPTVEEYARKWLKMQKAKVAVTTMRTYTYQVEKHIIGMIGDMYITEVKPDDIKLLLSDLSNYSQSVYRSVHMLLRCIFISALDNEIIDADPTNKTSAKGGVPPTNKEALSDKQIEILLNTIKGLPPYVFVMIGLYAGLRREEILGLQWDCVHLQGSHPYISVKRAWHTEHNRPVITERLKTEAAKRDVPIPKVLVACLKEAMIKSGSKYVISNSDGEPLSYTQFKRLWNYIVTRTARPRKIHKYRNGEHVVKTLEPELGGHCKNKPSIRYTIDFEVKPHQLRRTYITNLIYAGVDPKTVQYLAGHERSEITMDIYAKVKYNKPTELSDTVNRAFDIQK